MYGKAGRVGDRLLVVQNKADTGYPTINVLQIEKVSLLSGKGKIDGKLTEVITYLD